MAKGPLICPLPPSSGHSDLYEERVRGGLEALCAHSSGDRISPDDDCIQPIAREGP